MAQIPFGKLVGGTLGLLVGGPWGSALGVAVGHRFDQGIQDAELRMGSPQQADVERVFEQLGHFAVLDGRVCDEDVKRAYQIIEQLGLKGEIKQRSIKAFNKGRKVVHVSYTSTDEKASQLALWAVAQLMSGRELSLLQTMQLMVKLNHINKAIDPVAYGFVPGKNFDAFNARVMQSCLTDPYKILRVKSNDSLSVVSKARKKMLQKYHPDRLADQGSKEQIKHAEQQVFIINEAYKLIKLWSKINGK
ncbi:MAG: DnaJ domain-containing protein [bacterium]